MPIAELETLYTGNATQFFATHKAVMAAQDEFVAGSKVAADAFSSTKAIAGYAAIGVAAEKAASIQISAAKAVEVANLKAQETVQLANTQVNATAIAADAQVASSKIRSAARVKAAKLTANAEIVASENAAAAKIESTQMRLEAQEKARIARIEQARINAANRRPSLSKIGSALGTVGRGLTMGVTLPMAAVVGYSMKAAMDFEQEKAQLQRIAQLTDKEADALGEKFKAMSKIMPHSATELTKSAADSAQLGVPKEELAGWTEMAMRIKDTSKGLVDVNELVMQSTRFFEEMHIPKTTQNLKEFGSQLIALQPVGATTEGEIVDMGKRIASVGHSFGMTQVDVLALANSLVAMGVKSEVGGSSITRMEVMIDKATREGGKKLTLFAALAGQTSTEFVKSWHDAPGQTIAAIIEGLGQLKEKGGDAIGALGQLAGGGGGRTLIRFLQSVLPLVTSNVDGVNIYRKAYDALSKAQENGGRVMNDSQKLYGTTGSKVKELGNTANVAAIDLGGLFNKTLKDAAPILEKIINKIDDMIKDFEKLPEPTQQAYLKLALIVGLAGPFLTLAKNILQTVAAVQTLTGLSIGSGAFAVWAKAAALPVAGLFLAGNSGGTTEYDEINASKRDPKNQLIPQDAKGIKDKHDRTLAEYYLSIRNTQTDTEMLDFLEKRLKSDTDKSGKFDYGAPFGSVYTKDYFAGKDIEDAYQYKLNGSKDTSGFGINANQPGKSLSLAEIEQLTKSKFGAGNLRPGNLPPGTVIKDDGTIVYPSAQSQIPGFSGSIGPSGSHRDINAINNAAKALAPETAAEKAAKRAAKEAEKKAESARDTLYEEAKKAAMARKLYYPGSGDAGESLYSNANGLTERGNIDLQNRPRYKNPDGSISTVRSMSFEEGGKEILVPTISQQGQSLNNKQAIDEYHKSGQFLGKFKDANSATAFAQSLHKAQDQFYSVTASAKGLDTNLESTKTQYDEDHKKFGDLTKAQMDLQIATQKLTESREGQTKSADDYKEIEDAMRERIEQQRRQIDAGKTTGADAYSILTYGKGYNQLDKGNSVPYGPNRPGLARQDADLHSQIEEAESAKKGAEEWGKVWEAVGKAIEEANKKTREASDKLKENVATTLTALQDRINIAKASMLGGEESRSAHIQKTVDEFTKQNPKADWLTKAVIGGKAGEAFDADKTSKQFLNYQKATESLREEIAKITGETDKARLHAIQYADGIERMNSEQAKSILALQKYEEKFQQWSDKVKQFAGDVTNSIMSIIQKVEVTGGHGLGKFVGQTANQFARDQANKFVSDKLQGGLEKLTGGLFGKDKPKDQLSATNKLTDTLQDLINTLTNGGGNFGLGGGLGGAIGAGSGGGSGGGIIGKLLGGIVGVVGGPSNSDPNNPLGFGLSARNHSITVNQHFPNINTMDKKTGSQVASQTRKEASRANGKA